MERPLCPLCNTKHFAREAHAFKICESPVVETVPKEVVKVSEGTPEIARPRWKTREEYNAYMREYMKGWRKR